ncbi:MAG: CopG family transcriptional regulator [Acidobacteria bacterium]|nr:CopG family transcriptional regulator [Acidobacteriota bacterium]
MRTTLELDDDVLAAAKAIAVHRGVTAGQVISELARKGLRVERSAAPVRNGVPLLRSVAGRIVTPQMVDEVLDQA